MHLLELDPESRIMGGSKERDDIGSVFQFHQSRMNILQGRLGPVYPLTIMNDLRNRLITYSQRDIHSASRGDSNCLA